jgi:cation transporter-like permease
MPRTSPCGTTTSADARTSTSSCSTARAGGASVASTPRAATSALPSRRLGDLAALAPTQLAAAHRLGLDPDNHGIPLVTSTMDLVGAFSLLLALVVLGVA